MCCSRVDHPEVDRTQMEAAGHRYHNHPYCPLWWFESGHHHPLHCLLGSLQGAWTSSVEAAQIGMGWSRAGWISQLGRPPGGGHGNPLQDSCLENPMDRRAWQATVCRVTKNRTPLKWLSMQWPKGFSEKGKLPKTIMSLAGSLDKAVWGSSASLRGLGAWVQSAGPALAGVPGAFNSLESEPSLGTHNPPSWGHIHALWGGTGPRNRLLFNQLRLEGASASRLQISQGSDRPLKHWWKDMLIWGLD